MAQSLFTLTAHGSEAKSFTDSTIPGAQVRRSEIGSDLPAMLFPDTKDLFRDWLIVCPRQIQASTNVLGRVYYSTGSSTSQSIKWQIDLWRLQDNTDAINQAIGSGETKTVTGTSSSSADLIAYMDFTWVDGLGQVDEFVGGDLMRIRLSRDVTDTSTAEAEVFAVYLYQ